MLTPVHRNSDPITSAMADRDITLSGQRAIQIKQVYDAVKRFRNCTSRELAVLAKLPRYMVARRLSECTQVKKSGKRKCRHSGKMCVTWDLV